MRYDGITYCLPGRPIVWRLWRRLFCPRGWHLFDEVSSLEGRCLHCDACEFAVTVAD